MEFRKSCCFKVGAGVLSWQEKARKELAGLLGMERIFSEPRVDLDPQLIWERRNQYGKITKLSLQMDADFRNLVYVCIPDNAASPCRTFICLQGHTTGMHQSLAVDYDDETTPIETVPDDDFAIGCMKRGIAAICLEQRAFGYNSRDENHRHECMFHAMRALLVGETLLAQRIFDVDRVIDYIYSREDLVHDSIGVMGNSGGGTVSLFSGAMLPRLTHVMPSCCFSSFEKSIYSLRHCTCNYVPHLMHWGESSDVAGLIAPKPLVIVNGAQDPIFPLEAAKEQFSMLKNIYAAAGAEDKCVHVVGEGGHRFYADAAWPEMLKFF